MILALLVGCGPKVPPTTRPDSADTARDTATSRRPDDDCDGLDDDQNGIVDDGAAPGWWTDPSRWRTVATFEDAAEQRFVGALAAGTEATWVVVQEVAADFTSAAVTVHRVEADGSVAVAWISTGERGLPFVYAAAVDDAGDLWIGGAWYDPSTGARQLLAARWDGVLSSLPADQDAERVRLYAAVSGGAGAWFGGYAETAGTTAVWTVWRLFGDEAALVDTASLGGEGRVEGLAGGDPTVIAAGWQQDADGGTWGVIRTGDAEGDHVELSRRLGVRYTGVADGPDGGLWLGVNDAGGGGWTVQDETNRAVDTAEGTLTLLAGSPGRAWAAGTVADETATDVLVRAGDEAGFGVSLSGVAADGWDAEPHDLVVTPAGDVWLAVTETDPTGVSPTRARLLHLTCR